MDFLKMTEEQPNTEAMPKDELAGTEKPQRRSRTPRLGRSRRTPRKKPTPKNTKEASEEIGSTDPNSPLQAPAPAAESPSDNLTPDVTAPSLPESPDTATQATTPVPAAEIPVAPPVPATPPPPPVLAEGIVEVSGKGFGFLREAKRNFTQSNNDIFVTPEIIRKYGLRDGVWIKGETRRGNRGPQMYKLTEIEGEDPEKFPPLPVFEELTTINPNQRVVLETVPERYTTRVIDLVAPVGKGQRGLIVAPPRTGKTTLLQHIADAVVKNHPEMKLLILLVDERPEEVTEIRRTVPTAELMASSNDSDIKTHTRIAQLAIERAKRLVEMGKDVFVLMDSLTRIGRAFNNAQSGGGRTMSGGVDARALEIPRKLFAAARNTEEAGSLTILATALIETNSRMDDLIFQEFKGTGNMELVLDRKISDQRIYPAVDIFQSGTRREELLLREEDLHKISVIRRGLAGHKPIEAIERLLFFIRKYPTNAALLKNLPG
jgi:transcription termination factor Rho